MNVLWKLTVTLWCCSARIIRTEQFITQWVQTMKKFTRKRTTVHQKIMYVNLCRCPPETKTADKKQLCDVLSRLLLSILARSISSYSNFISSCWVWSAFFCLTLPWYCDNTTMGVIDHKPAAKIFVDWTKSERTRCNKTKSTYCQLKKRFRD